MTTTGLSPPQISPQEIKSLLAGTIAAERVLIRPIDLIAYASDASFYRLIPKAVVQAQSVEEIRALFALSQQMQVCARPHPDECYSSSRTCEIGMTRATGQIYRSYMYLLEKATR